MIHRRYFLLILAIIIIINAGFTSRGSAVDLFDINVSPGYTFNLEVVENPTSGFGGMTRPANMTVPENDTEREGGFFGSNFTESFVNYAMALPFTTPEQNFVFSVTVESIPANETPGKIGVDTDNDGEYDHEIADFILGMPVVSTDWDGWTEVLNEVVETGNSLDEIKSATLNSLTNNETVFGFNLTFDLVIPEEMNSFITINSMMMTQTMNYNKSNGVMSVYSFSGDIDVFLFGKFSFATRMRFTDRPVNKTVVDSTGSSNNWLDYAFIIVIPGSLGVTGVGVYYYRSRKKTSGKQAEKQAGTTLETLENNR